VQHFCICQCSSALHLAAPYPYCARNRDGGGPWPGAVVEVLLQAFDEVGKEHERMEADKFNDDGTYKAGINKVRAVFG
jgi:hypothetical protein